MIDSANRQRREMQLPVLRRDDDPRPHDNTHDNNPQSNHSCRHDDAHSYRSSSNSNSKFHHGRRHHNAGANCNAVGQRGMALEAQCACPLATSLVPAKMAHVIYGLIGQ